MSEVRAVAFDVNETLFSLEGLSTAFAAAGLDAAMVPLWFTGVLRDGFALAAMGEFRTFLELAAEQLRALWPEVPDGATRVLAAFRELEPHPDVAPALRMLRDAGVPAVTLTNGSAEVVAALLRRAGLAHLIRANLSVDSVRRWKPAPEPYQWAAGEVGVAAGELALVACHPWDCAGARNAGLVAGWVHRDGESWPSVFPPPAVHGSDLPQVIAALLGRGG